MSIIILDGTKLRKIKKIESFLENAHKNLNEPTHSQDRFHYEGAGGIVRQMHQSPQIKNIEKPEQLQVSNNPETFSMLKKNLEETYVQVYKVDPEKNVVKEEYVPSKKIFGENK